MKDVDQIINEMYEEYLKSDPDIKEKFKNTKKKDLIEFHHQLGRHIRNKYKLWELKWEPEIDKRGVDMSPYHPDEVSMTIIEKVWEKAQNEEPKKRNPRFLDRYIRLWKQSI